MMAPFTAFRVYTAILLVYDIHSQVIPPPSMVVRIGDDVSLTCTSSESAPTFKWTFASDDVSSQLLYFGDIDRAPQARYSNIVLRRGTDIHTSILGINAIQLEEEGRYQCTTTTASSTPPATVVAVKDIHSQVIPPPSMVVRIGDDVSLTCTSSESAPTFKWTFASDDVSSQLLYFGDIDRAPQARYSNIVLRRGTDIHTSILGINAIQLEEEGRYQCTTTTASSTPPATVVAVKGTTVESSPSGLSFGDYIGIAVLVILLVASIIIIIVQFILLRRTIKRGDCYSSTLI
ncbi:uncharacterized protein LOC121420366 [Lytechinus variegatus]|uniref:uncharacterized protein LOC121420366 n=1 Tax=Lytechinus variegatus TaxID=7654 RepID=UPI001BB13A88|nr:uncharacterized protein LOC121420366 [Lytechinus variegatus]